MLHHVSKTEPKGFSQGGETFTRESYPAIYAALQSCWKSLPWYKRVWFVLLARLKIDTFKIPDWRDMK